LNGPNAAAAAVADLCGVEEGTEELEAAGERALEGARQLGPVRQVARHHELIEIAEHNVPAAGHLPVQAVLDRRRLTVVPGIHAFKRMCLAD